MIYTPKNKLPAALFLTGISAHLIAESIRRFYYYSNSVYFIADLVLLLTVAVASRIGSLRFDSNMLFMLSVYVAWGMLSVIVSREDPRLILIGLRPIALGLLGFIIAENFFRLHKHPVKLFLNVTGIWTAIILLVAVLQIALGVNATINNLPSDANSELGGRGSYDVGDTNLGWLFRPTSIFMHTGRLGQYSFFLALVLSLPALLNKQTSRGLQICALMSVVLVIVSGQRAAGVLLLTIIVVVTYLFGSRKTLERILMASITFPLILLAVSSDLSATILARFGSGVTGGGARAVDMTQHWDIGFEQFPLFGKGLGFFSFGGQTFGGESYFDFMSRFGGGGENSWLRIQGETGIPGLLIFLFIIIYITVKAYSRAMSTATTDRSLHLSAAFFSGSSVFWAFTHDIYGNYLYLIGLFILFGASSGLARVGRRNV